MADHSVKKPDSAEEEDLFEVAVRREGTEKTIREDTDREEYDRMLKKQEKLARRQARKNIRAEENALKKEEKEKQRAEREQKKEDAKAPSNSASALKSDTEKTESNTTDQKPAPDVALPEDSESSGEYGGIVGPVPPSPGEPKAPQHASAAPRGRYAKVLTTGQYVGTFCLMLIPFINIICVIVWALGGAKNPNKVNFVRGCIAFFLIEVLLTALIGGGYYIYLNQNESRYLSRLNHETNGLINYFDIDHYDELKRLKNITPYLVEKKNIGTKKDARVRATRVIENPSEIRNYRDFQKMYQTYKPGTDYKSRNGARSETDKDGYYIGERFSGKAKTLENLMKKYHIDATRSQLVYIILDSRGSDNCVIAFDPTGEIQSIPTVQINHQTIYLGGVS
ncbi:MAG: hypothetical protein PUC71_02400 [Oscillospiraceae bacterium]|nr:hypothetical protein [Oscillospiraceae bacterium]